MRIAKFSEFTEIEEYKNFRYENVLAICFYCAHARYKKNRHSKLIISDPMGFFFTNSPFAAGNIFEIICTSRLSPFKNSCRA